MYSRRIRFKKSQTGSLAENPGNKPQAVALGYDPEVDPAPRVLASGKGKIAEQIIAIAEQNRVPIKHDPILAAALAEIDVNTIIPPELYQVVAQLLAYIYRLRK